MRGSSCARCTAPVDHRLCGGRVAAVEGQPLGDLVVADDGQESAALSLRSSRSVTTRPVSVTGYVGQSCATGVEPSAGCA